MTLIITKGLRNSTEIDAGDVIKQAKAELIAEDFTKYLNEFHMFSEPYDDAMDAWIHSCYATVKAKRTFFDFKSQPHFSPSSANSCDRELYEKVLKAKRDENDGKPYRRRWTALGTAVGDVIQREILLAERHFKKYTEKPARFVFERTPDGYPAFEDFIKKMHVIKHNGKTFSLFGAGDGILKYLAEDGEELRVGLEVKSKQTTHAQTSYNSMKEAKEDHVKQCVCYSLMYDVDYFIILYVNVSKKGWFMTEDDVERYPDIRAFGVYITEEMKNTVLDKFAGVLTAVETKTPPRLDLSKTVFNNFKTHIAKNLTDEEWLDIDAQIGRIQASKMPDWLKRQYVNAVDDLKERRGVVDVD